MIHFIGGSRIVRELGIEFLQSVGDGDNALQLCHCFHRFFALDSESIDCTLVHLPCCRCRGDNINRIIK